MTAEDLARYELWERLSQSAVVDSKLRLMTDAEVADLLLEVYGRKAVFSLEETVISHVRERLLRSGGGALPFQE